MADADKLDHAALLRASGSSMREITAKTGNYSYTPDIQTATITRGGITSTHM